MNEKDYRTDYRRRVLKPYLGERRILLDRACAEIRNLRGEAPQVLDLVVLYDVRSNMTDTERRKQIDRVHNIWAKGSGDYKTLSDPLQRIQRYLTNVARPHLYSTQFWEKQFADNEFQIQGRLREFRESHELERAYGVYGVVTQVALRDKATQFGFLPGEMSEYELQRLASDLGLKVTTTIREPRVTLEAGLDEVFLSDRLTLLHAVFGNDCLKEFSIIDGFKTQTGLKLTVEAVNNQRDKLKAKSQDADTIRASKALGAIENMRPQSDRELLAIIFSHLLRQVERDAPPLATQRVKYLKELGLSDTDAGRIALHVSIRETPSAEPGQPVFDSLEEELDSDAGRESKDLARDRTLSTEACPRCGRPLDPGASRRCGVCHWRSPDIACRVSKSAARGDGGYRGSPESGSKARDPVPVERSDARASSHSRASGPVSAQSGRAAPVASGASGDGPHTTSDVQAGASATHWNSASPVLKTIACGRIVEVQPQQLETLDRRAESLARGVAMGCLLAPFRIVALLLGLIFAKRLAMMALARGRHSPRFLAPVQISVTPFRVRTDNGSITQCVLRGELRGGSLSVGDRVELQGRVSRRTNVLNATTVTHLDSGAIIRPYLPPAARTSKAMLALAIMSVIIMMYLFLAIVT